MMWQVTDEGRVEARMRAEGIEAVKTAREDAARFIANVTSDLSMNLGVEVVTDELRFSVSKTRPEITVIWKARAPVEKVADVREYMATVARSLNPLPGEVLGRDNDVPDQ
jgi:hypothetical protein